MNFMVDSLTKLAIDGDENLYQTLRKLNPT